MIYADKPGLPPDFPFERLMASVTAKQYNIDNVTINPEYLANLHELAWTLDALQTALGFSLTLDSVFRCYILNKRVGGVPNSQHTTGQAADILCPKFGTPIQVCQFIETHWQENYVQVIHEFGRWTHLGIAPFPIQPENRIITIDTHGTRTGLLPIRT
jgi:zinc D-Ala-D-Ala carboxypeptidase